MVMVTKEIESDEMEKVKVEVTKLIESIILLLLIHQVYKICLTLFPHRLYPLLHSLIRSYIDMPFDLALDSVHALVTGASGGIGIVTTQAFLDNGALVTAHYNSNPDSLKEIKHDRLAALKADVRDESQVDELFVDAKERLGKAVEVLVVNHAYVGLTDYPIASMPLSEWNKTIGINLTGAFIMVKAFLKQLKYVEEKNRHKIAVVFVGSTAGLIGEAGHADYASTKSALMNGFTLSLKNEIVKIAPLARVNVVAPGWVRTPAVASALANPTTVYNSIATVPLRKFALPLDIANQILFLASSSASGHVTGQVVMVHGGMEGRLLNREEDIRAML